MYSGDESSTVFKEYIMTLKVTEPLQKDEVKFKKASSWNYSFEIALDDDYASISNGESISNLSSNICNIPYTICTQ